MNEGERGGSIVLASSVVGELGFNLIPATSAPAGEVKYFMTDPDGEKFGGWWGVSEVEPRTSLSFVDGFAGEDGEPNAEMPKTTVRVELSERDGGTRMELRSVSSARRRRWSSSTAWA